MAMQSLFPVSCMAQNPKKKTSRDHSTNCSSSTPSHMTLIKQGGSNKDHDVDTNTLVFNLHQSPCAFYMQSSNLYGVASCKPNIPPITMSTYFPSFQFTVLGSQIWSREAGSKYINRPFMTTTSKYQRAKPDTLGTKDERSKWRNSKQFHHNRAMGSRPIVS